MITLSSDFGTPYPAAMRGVILARTDAQLVDIAHDFPRQNVRAAGFWLRQILPFFPPAVHLVVVDPGVGTDRAALAMRSGNHALVGPDNGVLFPAASALGSIEVFELPIEDPVSSTFHGRDVFAPAAAAIHEAGIDTFPQEMDVTPKDTCEELVFPEPTRTDRGVTGEVLVVDGFGNAITNIPGTVLTDRFGDKISVNGERVPVARSYAGVNAGARLVTIGSHGNVELAVNQGRGDTAFAVNPEAPVSLKWST